MFVIRVRFAARHTGHKFTYILCFVQLFCLNIKRVNLSNLLVFSVLPVVFRRVNYEVECLRQFHLK